MRTWHLDQRPAGGTLPLADAAALLEGALSKRPAQDWLCLLQKIAQVDYLSVVQYVPDADEGISVTPRLIDGVAAPGVANVTAACFAIYRERFWRYDEATRLAQHARAAHAISVLHVAADDIVLPSWRQEIYDRIELDSRLTFLYQLTPDTTFALNVFRRQQRGSFAQAQIEALLGLAPLLPLAHRASLASSMRSHTTGIDRRVDEIEPLLRGRLPELSRRETAVCARIALGMSADGIAVDLDVAPSTVATLRKRAYAKLARRGLSPGRAQLARWAE